MDDVEWDKVPGDTSKLDFQLLTRVPMNGILKNVPLTDIIEMGFVNSEMRKAIREAGIRIDEFWIYYRNEKPRIQFTSTKNDRFSWNLYMPQPERDVEAFEILTATERATRFRRRVSYFTLDCVKNRHGLFCTHHDLENALTKIFVHFVGMFNCSDAVVNTLLVDVNTVDDFRTLLEHFRYFKIKNLILKQNTPRSVLFLEQAISHLDVIDSIQFGMHIGRTKLNEMDVQRLRNKVLAIPHVYFDTCMWLKSDEILLSQSKIIMIGKPNTLGPDDLRAFVKSWLNGGFPNLLWLNVKMNKHWRLKEIVEGVPTTPIEFCLQSCSSSRRLIRGEAQTFSFLPNSVQVTRNDDDAVATIGVSCSQFFFNVEQSNNMFFPSSQSSEIDTFEERDATSQCARLIEINDERRGGLALEEHFKVRKNVCLPSLQKLEFFDKREDALKHPAVEGPTIRAEIRKTVLQMEKLRAKEIELRNEMAEKAQASIDGKPEAPPMDRMRATCTIAVDTIRGLFKARDAVGERKKAFEAVLADAGIPDESEDDVPLDDIPDEEVPWPVEPSGREMLLSLQNLPKLTDGMTMALLIQTELETLRDEFNAHDRAPCVDLPIHSQNLRLLAHLTALEQAREKQEKTQREIGVNATYRARLEVGRRLASRYMDEALNVALAAQQRDLPFMNHVFAVQRPAMPPRFFPRLNNE